MKNEIKSTSGIQTAEFARMCGTTKRTLCHYESIGLLEPECRGENGYRSYGEAQYALFLIIDTLKTLGMPLKEIRSYLDRRSPEELKKLLDTQEEQVERELEKLLRVQRIIRTKQALLREGEQAETGRVFFRRMPEESLVLSERIDSAEKGRVSAALHRHMLHCSQARLDTGHPFGAMIAEEDIAVGRFDRYEYFFTKIEGGPLPEGCFRKPAGLYAVTYLRGDYHSPEGAYRLLLDRIGEQGFEICGDSYKEGIVDETAALDPDRFLTKISIPVREKRGVQNP